MIAWCNSVLQGTADWTKLAGMYMATLNDAAQTYALADQNSFVPPE